MHPSEATLELRPRNAWEAVDLGVLLAQQHRGILMTSWALVTLPVFALLSVLLHEHPSLALLLFWWLKPVFDRLPLLILSQALFGPAPTVRQALQAWPKTLKTQLLPSLLWRRLSWSRSFVLPVQQLENLSGAARALRIETLSHGNRRAARLLTLVGYQVELALWAGLTMLLYALIPQQLEIDWLWRSLLAQDDGWNWLDHLSNAFYALILIAWEPVYVACGFSLYLNRRTVLEAWDIELVFKRLRQRLLGPACILLASAALILLPGQTPAWADERSFSCPIPETPTHPVAESSVAPDTPRLMRQALNSQAAQQSIKESLQQPPFRNPKVVSGWRFSQAKDTSGQTAGSDITGFLARWLNWLLESANVVAVLLEVLLWAALIGLAGLLGWRYRSWLQTFAGPASTQAKPLREAPLQLFGLEVRSETLPDDIAGSAERLWASQPREALGLLYRGLLNRMLTDHRLPLKSADTEGEILDRIEALNRPPLSEFSQRLTLHWQNLAYGHQLPPIESRQELCEGWRRLFEEGTRP